MKKQYIMGTSKNRGFFLTSWKNLLNCIGSPHNESLPNRSGPLAREASPLQYNRQTLIELQLSTMHLNMNPLRKGEVFRATLIFIFLFFFINSLSYTQENKYKEQAIEAFKIEHYDEAISLLENAIEISPNDSEIYYYLGFFNHYRAYDSRPLKGYDYSYSQKIFDYLDKAISINPNYGDAKYFYGAECCANAFVAVQKYDSEELRYYYNLAFEKGAYPKWLIELGTNILNSCDKDAILFTGGDADFGICSYLQLIKNIRTDVTVIPIGYIDRPAYIQFLKNGFEGFIRKININLTDEQIMDIHPFKWKETTIYIPTPERYVNEFKLTEEHKLEWKVEPDLFSEREHSKIESESPYKRSYLSPQRAILLQIVEDNYSSRPICFTNFIDIAFLGGLNIYFQNYGLISKLLPFQTQGTEYQLNLEQLYKLFVDDNLSNYSTIRDTNIQRISGITFVYHSALLQYARMLKEIGNNKRLDDLIEFFSSNLKIRFDEDYEERVSQELLKIKNN